MSTIGKSVPRIDAVAKVTGKAKYPGDFQFSDQLVMKVLFAHRAMHGWWLLTRPKLRLLTV